MFLLFLTIILSIDDKKLQFSFSFSFRRLETKTKTLKQKKSERQNGFEAILIYYNYVDCIFFLIKKARII